MKIGIDAREAFGQRTGKGQVVFHLLQELASRQDHEFYIFLDKDIVIPFENVFKKVVIEKSGLLWHMSVPKRLKKLGLDVYFSPTSYIVPAFTKFPMVTIVSDLVSFLGITKHQAKATFVERLTIRRAVRNSRKLIAISESTKKDLERLYPESQGKVDAVHLASATIHKTCDRRDEYEKIKKDLGIDGRFILFVGTLEPRKNIEGMIRAYAYYRKAATHEKEVPKLVIIGKKGWYYESIFTLVSELGLSESVIFAGFVEDEILPCFYNEAQCFFFPSLYEGFGLIVLEAFEMGCPVITAENSSLPEVAGKAAVYVNPRDTKDMADGLARLLENESLQRELVEKGYEQLGQFSWKKTADQMLLIIESSCK